MSYSPTWRIFLADLFISFLRFIVFFSLSFPTKSFLFSPIFSSAYELFLDHFLPFSPPPFSVAFFPYLSFFICASVWSPVQASNEVPRITQEKKLAPLSACRGGSLAAGECANSTFLSVPFAWFALTSGLQQPAENDQILVRSTPRQVSLGYPNWRTATKLVIRHENFKKKPAD